MKFKAGQMYRAFNRGIPVTLLEIGPRSAKVRFASGSKCWLPFHCLKEY